MVFLFCFFTNNAYRQDFSNKIKFIAFCFQFPDKYIYNVYFIFTILDLGSCISYYYNFKYMIL